MSRRFKPISAVLAAACCTLALISPTASAATTASEVTSGVGTEPAGSVDAYWTEARMQAATPMVAPSPPTGDPTTRPDEPDVSASADGDAGPADPLSTASTESTSSEALAYFRESKVWAGHGKLPARSIGKLYSTHPDGDYSCTATVIASRNHSTIWTAGHCVSNGHRGWYRNFKFVPDYHNGAEHPYGTWTAKAWSVPTRYHDGADHYYDMAALALNSNSRGKVGDVVGWQGYKFGRTPSSATYANVRAFGYAANTHPARQGITGKDLRYCVGSSTVPGYRQIPCDMGSGASGGPWLYDLSVSRGWGYLIGNHSFHSGASDPNIYGPPLGQAAINVHADVQAR